MLRVIRLLRGYKEEEQSKTDNVTSTCESMNHSDYMKELEEAITVLESYYNVKRQMLKRVRKV